MQGKCEWKDEDKRDVDFKRATRYQNGYSCPGSIYKVAPPDNGMEQMIENILEIQNRSYSELSKKMDNLFLEFDMKINRLKNDVGKLNARMEALEQVIGVRRVMRYTRMIKAMQAMKSLEEEVEEKEEACSLTCHLVDRPASAVDRPYSMVDRPSSVVGRLTNGRWTLSPVDRPLPQIEREGCPLMKQPPVKEPNCKNDKLHSVMPWISIEDYDLDKIGFEEEVNDWVLKKKIEPIAKEMLRDMPFARACHLEDELKTIIERIMKFEMSPENGSMIFAAMCDQAIKYRVPKKEKDPGNFELSMTIGSRKFENCLCDLGASSNTMSLELAMELGLRDIRGTNMTFKLADNSEITPIGKVKDIPVMIGDRFAPLDFYILEDAYSGEEEEEQIILGREFLKTAGALIDCTEDTITLRNLGSPYLTFKIDKEEEDFEEEYEELMYESYKKPQRRRFAVITKTTPRKKVIKRPEKKVMIRMPIGRPTDSVTVDRPTSPEPRRRTFSMPSLSPVHRGIQSTSKWFRPEHIEYRIPYYSREVEMSKERIRNDTEGLVEECIEVWPLIEQCGLEAELRRYIPLLLEERMTVRELCNVMARACDEVIDKVIDRQIPKKQEDFGKPTIGCMIGYTWFEEVVCDTGAGVNLMPLSIAQMLRYDKLLEKQVLLRLADGSYKYTEGLLENVPVHTRDQFLAVDFHVMKFDRDTEDALIFGRPFLHAAHAEINCRTGKVTIRAKEVNDEERIQMNGNRPAGFSHTLPRGTFQPIPRNMRHTSTRKHVFAASLRYERIRKEEASRIIDLTEDTDDDEIEEDPEEEPMDDKMSGDAELSSEGSSA